MESIQSVDILDLDPGVLPLFPGLGGFGRTFKAHRSHEGLIEHQIAPLQTLVVTKLVAGFDDDCVERLRGIVEDVAAGRRGALKFLVHDFAHHVERDSEGGVDFSRLVNELANLILRAPIISVACVRAHMAGADLELALACNMMIAQSGRRFFFAADPALSLGTYGFLAQKIGFVRAERLMESSVGLDAAQMADLLLVKATLEPGAGFAAVEQVLARAARRHNASYAIYRAQRIARPAYADAADEARSA
jgi:enoyl-CoA hydratase/carnithine racemase